MAKFFDSQTVLVVALVLFCSLAPAAEAGFSLKRPAAGSSNLNEYISSSADPGLELSSSDCAGDQCSNPSFGGALPVAVQEGELNSTTLPGESPKRSLMDRLLSGFRPASPEPEPEAVVEELMATPPRAAEPPKRLLDRLLGGFRPGSDSASAETEEIVAALPKRLGANLLRTFTRGAAAEAAAILPPPEATFVLKMNLLKKRLSTEEEALEELPFTSTENLLKKKKSRHDEL